MCVFIKKNTPYEWFPMAVNCASVNLITWQLTGGNNHFHERNKGGVTIWWYHLFLYVSEDTRVVVNEFVLKSRYNSLKRMTNHRKWSGFLKRNPYKNIWYEAFLWILLNLMLVLFPFSRRRFFNISPCSFELDNLWNFDLMTDPVDLSFDKRKNILTHEVDPA